MTRSIELLTPGNPTVFKGSLTRAQGLEIIDGLADRCNARLHERDTVKALHNAFRTFSGWSAQHSVRVGMLSAMLAEAAGWKRHDAARLGLCSCLHDIGKLAIPKSILDKDSRLLSDEREIIEEHVKHGLGVLSGLRASFQSIANLVVEHHHENFDGTGYPDKLLGSEIPEEVRIARIVDFYDAVNFDRPYRPGLVRSDTVSLMDQSSPIFDPGYFAVFKANLDLIESQLKHGNVPL